MIEYEISFHFNLCTNLILPIILLLKNKTYLIFHSCCFTVLLHIKKYYPISKYTQFKSVWSKVTEISFPRANIVQSALIGTSKTIKIRLLIYLRLNEIIHMSWVQIAKWHFIKNSKKKNLVKIIVKTTNGRPFNWKVS